MKKTYSLPEFDVVKFDLSSVICAGIGTSGENVVPGQEEFIDGDDP